MQSRGMIVLRLVSGLDFFTVIDDDDDDGGGDRLLW